jgi:hypothetical protein
MEEAALRKLIRATLGLAFVAAFSLASTTNAASIVEFSQATPGQTITSSNVGNNTTLSVTGNPTSVTVSKLAGLTPPPPGTSYIETFTFSSTTPPSGSDGNMSQGGFSGSFSYSLGGVTQVAGNITGGILTTITNGSGGTTVNFNTSNVQFTTVAAPILQQTFGTSNIPLTSLIGTYQLTLTPVPNPTNSLNFTASAGGIITAQVVPEPASVVMASMALVAGLGGVGLRRIKVSRA